MNSTSFLHVISALALSVTLIAPSTGLAADSVLKDNSVDSKFSSDSAPSVDTQAMKHGKKPPGLGDGMMVKMRKHPPSKEALTPKIPTGPQPGAPPVQKTNEGSVVK